MPSIYAHYRFGSELLPKLPPELQRSARRFRQLYDMGLHGPDLFFYYHPLVKTSVGKLGSKFHEQSGKVFFERVCRSIQLNPSEGAMAYLSGVLAHYALDSLSHPYITRMADQRKAAHSEIETEFDRFLLEKDGKTPAYLQDQSAHIQLTAGECETVASFYPSASAGVIRRCVKNMARCTRMLVLPQGIWRKVFEKAIGITGRENAGMLMTVEPNPRCAGLDPSLLRLYEMSMDRYLVLLDEIQALFRRKAPLGPDFSMIFG